MYYEDLSLNRYAKMAFPFSPNAKIIINDMQSCLKTLKKIDSRLSTNVKRVNIIINSTVNMFPSKYDRSKYTNEVCFVISKYTNIFMKYQSLRFKQYNQMRKDINDFASVISGYLKRNVPIQIQLTELLNSVYGNFYHSTAKLEFKLKALYNYIKNISNVSRCKAPSNDAMYDEMKKLSSRVDVINEYIEQNKFDSMFESFIGSNEVLANQLYQIIGIHLPVVKSPKNKNNSNNQNNCLDNFYNDKEVESLILNDYNFFIKTLKNKRQRQNDKNSTVKIKNGSNFECILQKLYLQIASSSQIDEKMFIVVRCAAIRFIFSKYYTLHCEDYHNKTNEELVHNCLNIFRETMNDLLIIPSYNYYSILNVPSFIKNIDSVQFLICPIDICNEVNSFKMRGNHC